MIHNGTAAWGWPPSRSTRASLASGRGAATFRLKASVRIADDADRDKTLAAVAAALRAAYSFAARDFGQPVTIDEAYAVIQDVAGIVAADIQQLYRNDVGIVAAYSMISRARNGERVSSPNAIADTSALASN